MDGLKAESKRLMCDLLELCMQSGLSSRDVFDVVATFTTMLARTMEEAGEGSKASESLMADMRMRRMM